VISAWWLDELRDFFVAWNKAAKTHQLTRLSSAILVWQRDDLGDSMMFAQATS